VRNTAEYFRGICGLGNQSESIEFEVVGVLFNGNNRKIMKNEG
jgi:hypothetical protein